MTLIDRSYSTYASVSRHLIISRQNPVLVGYFFAAFPDILSYGDDLAVFLEHNLIAVLKDHIAAFDYLIYSTRGFAHIRKALAAADMLVCYMRKTSALIAPYNIYVAEAVTMEYTKRISAFSCTQERKRTLRITRKLVIYIPEHTAAHRLKLCIAPGIRHSLSALITPIRLCRCLCFALGIHTLLYLAHVLGKSLRLVIAVEVHGGNTPATLHLIAFFL